jgi:hypothetical protein
LDFSTLADEIQSWNVYNPANVAKVKADEEAAAAREAANDQRMQELDAERRAAILRGRTPPPLPVETEKEVHGHKRNGEDRGHDKKRRKLKGEDDTDMDIRLAASMAAPGENGENAKILKLRNTTSDAPLTDHAGHIDLFPVDIKETRKREKNADAEKEKKRKEKALEDQYTMRFSNAAGRGGLDDPWYTAPQQPASGTEGHSLALVEDKNVWGNEDPRRKEREQARISSSDPFASMQKAQSQLKKSKEDKKRWAAERNRELQDLRDAQDHEDRRRHHKRLKTDDYADRARRDKDRTRSSRRTQTHTGRSRSRDRHQHHSKHRSERRRSRSLSRDRERESRHKRTSVRQL